LTKDKHIIVLRFSSLGDVAIIIPLLRCIIAKYKKLKITIVTIAKYNALFNEFKNINIVNIDKDFKHKGFLGLIKLFNQLKKLKPTAIADLHSVLRTNILEVFFRFSFIKFKRIYKGRVDKAKLCRKKNKVFSPLTPTIYRYKEVFRKLGFEVNLENHFYPLKPNFPFNFEFINKKNQKKIIGIAPFSAHKGKTYPLDLMQKVIAFLQRDYTVILFGGGKYETLQIKIWERAYKNVKFFSDKMSFNQELNLIANLDLMISMDSANGHIASNYNIDVITIWGMTHPFIGFAPWNQPEKNNIILDLEKFPLIPTSTYGKIIPNGYSDAMRTITPKHIIEKVLDVMNVD
tara:strand:- start:31576 stop:32613 length:1038 start_codon:yes stop_codon:yes gene_type:complete